MSFVRIFGFIRFDLILKPDLPIAISSLVVAIQMITTYTKKLKYRRKIILVTNGEGSMSTDGLDEIVRKLKSDGIELVVLYAFHFSFPFLVAGMKNG